MAANTVFCITKYRKGGLIGFFFVLFKIIYSLLLHNWLINYMLTRPSELLLLRPVTYVNKLIVLKIKAPRRFQRNPNM